MKKGLVGFMLIMCMAISAPQDVQAAQTVWELAESQHYGRKAGGMLGRGLLNVATSPIDLIVHTVEGTQEGPPLLGTLTGLGSGLGCTALRASSGIIDVATFWVPGFNGFRIGRSYSNCLEEVTAPRPVRAPVAAAPQQPSYEAAAPARTATPHDPTAYVKRGGPQQHAATDYVKRGRGTVQQQDSRIYVK